MNLILRSYQTADLDSMRKLWNQIVEEGQAFPQVEGLTEEGGRDFFLPRRTAALQRTRILVRFSDFISYTPTISADAAISPTPAMRSVPACGDSGSENGWWRTPSNRPKNRGFGFCSITLS